MKRQGGQTFGRYVLVRELGAGGMGEVWEAHDPSLDRPVAIKFVRAALASNASYVERLKREALAAARIKHDNVGRVYDLGTEGDQLYLVMELIDGVDMKTLLGRVPGGRLDMVRACYFAWQVLRGLAAAHAAGVVHRDLKPENVMVSEGGHVTVIDFGLAGEGPQSRLGTARFLSPEAVNGAPADARADLYAVGLMLYLALAGEGPYPDVRAADTDEAAIVAAHLFAEPAPLDDERGVPDELWRVIERLLRKTPEERFQTAEDAAGALAHCMTGSVPPSHPLGMLIAKVQAPGRAWTPSPAPVRVVDEPTAPLPGESTTPPSAPTAPPSTLAWAPRTSHPAGSARRVSPWIAVALVILVPLVVVSRVRSPNGGVVAPAALSLAPTSTAPPPAPTPTMTLGPAPAPPPAPTAPEPAHVSAVVASASHPRKARARVRPAPTAVTTAAPPAPTASVPAAPIASVPPHRLFNVEE